MQWITADGRPRSRSIDVTVNSGMIRDGCESRTFLVSAHPGCLGVKAIKQVCLLLVFVMYLSRKCLGLEGRCLGIGLGTVLLTSLFPSQSKMVVLKHTSRDHSHNAQKSAVRENLSFYTKNI